MSGLTPARLISERAVRRRSCSVQWSWMQISSQWQPSQEEFPRAGKHIRVRRKAGPRPDDVERYPWQHQVAAGSLLPGSLGTDQVPLLMSSHLILTTFSRRCAVSSSNLVRSPMLPVAFHRVRISSSVRMRSRAPVKLAACRARWANHSFRAAAHTKRRGRSGAREHGRQTTCPTCPRSRRASWLRHRDG